MKVFTGLIFSALLLISCARPDYVTTPSYKPTNEKPENDECSYPLKTLQACLFPQWEQIPDSTKYNSLKVSILHLKAPIDTQLTALLWMPSMGHGSSPVKIEQLSETEFRIYDIFFIMRGDWEVRIYFKSAETTIDQVFIPVLL